jgi:thiol-disulfide isomerase/thioredoxin
MIYRMSFSTGRREAGKMKLREQMPELDGATAWLNSNALTKRDLIGHKPTLIHYWSISCELCKKAMPYVNEIRDEYKNDLMVIAVHMPRSSNDLNLDQIRAAAKNYNITQPIFIDSDHRLSNTFHNQYVPAYYVFDIAGQLRHFQAGDAGIRMLKNRVHRILGSNN